MDSTAGLNRLGRLAGSSAPSSRSLFFFTLGATLILRLLIAVLLVFTGDEAYYYFWGLHPALAYYDHPGMVGWLLAPFALTGNAEWWIRLPAVLLLPAVAWLTVVLARPAGATRAYLAGTAVMLVPPELFNVLSTTDTPLVFFSLASVAAYQRALAAADGGGVNRWHWLAGLLLGAAFCSKYFAVLLGLGYLVHALIAPRRERPWPGLAALVAAAAPWVLLNIYANYEHCWLNILFNLYSRNDNIGFSAATIANYAGVVLYTTSPVLLWLLVRDGDRFRQQFHDPRRRIVVCACIVPLVAFALLSTVKTIGLHWVFAFSPLVFVLGAFMLDERSLRLDVRFLTLFSLAHLLAICILWALPLETWSRTRLYDGLVLTVEPMEMLNALRPYRSGYSFATDGYSNSVTLSYQARRHEAWGPHTPAEWDQLDFLVFGPGSAHGRQQDVFDDFRRLDGQNILVLRKTPPPHGDYDPFFASTVYKSFVVRGVTYYVILGDRFSYRRYRDDVLAAIRDKFYRTPPWLPSGDCFFTDRYFAGSHAPRS